MQITSNLATAADALSGSASNENPNPTATDQGIGFQALFRNASSPPPEASTIHVPSSEAGLRALFGHPEPLDGWGTKSEGPDMGFEALFRSPDAPAPVNAAGQTEATEATGFAALFSSPGLTVSTDVEDSLLSA